MRPVPDDGSSDPSIFLMLYPELHTDGKPDREKVLARIRETRPFLLNATSYDHPADIFDAAYELADLSAQLDRIDEENKAWS
jgi:hypothetical protein